MTKETKELVSVLTDTLALLQKLADWSGYSCSREREALAKRLAALDDSKK